MSKVEAVIFDMDGLMFDTEPIYYQANQNTADKLGMDYSFKVYEQFIGSGDIEYRTKMRKIYSNHGDDLLDQFFVDSTKELEYILLHGQVDMKPGLLELLKYLQKEKIIAIVASSTNRILVDQLLERLNVRQYFQGVIGGDEVEMAKPHPEIFNRAFDKTKLEDKQNALVLEDSKNGVKAAYGAELPTILIPDLLTPDEEIKDKVVAVFSDLHQVINYINNKNN